MNEPIVATSDNIMRILKLLRNVPSLKASAHQKLRRYPAFKEKMKPIPSSLGGRLVVPCVIMTADHCEPARSDQAQEIVNIPAVLFAENDRRSNYNKSSLIGSLVQPLSEHDLRFVLGSPVIVERCDWAAFVGPDRREASCIPSFLSNDPEDGVGHFVFCNEVLEAPHEGTQGQLRHIGDGVVIQATLTKQ